ncbi:MAG: metalloregulator ArsR/SmtB family transcription factor [Chlamydiota bacterium]|nr:metalloregulator ArsR/SmtB family transcription factor [Chlamydiota bacterium]
MTSISIEVLEKTAHMLKLLAHPQRLKIIEILEKNHEAPVHVISEALDLPQAATSHHLNQMKRVGLVSTQRRGKEVWYAIADRRSLRILDCIRSKKNV